MIVKHLNKTDVSLLYLSEQIICEVYSFKGNFSDKQFEELRKLSFVQEIAQFNKTVYINSLYKQEYALEQILKALGE